MSKAADLERLARWRTLGARHSEEVVELARGVLGLASDGSGSGSGGVSASGLGDQEWAVREQLAIAALDLGMIRLATTQIDLLHRQFPESPRVNIVGGLRLEAKGDVKGAKAVYDELLREDETNVSAHQRLIALSLSSSPATTTIPLLLTYLDTFYSDPAGWSLLAELYADQGLYPQSLNALGHMVLICPWDEGAVRRSGEVAYTMGDYQLALKYFLRATEMEGGPEEKAGRKRTRSWWGVQLASKRILDSPTAETSVPADARTFTKQLEALERLAIERLLAAGGNGLEARRGVLGQKGVVR